MPELRTTTATGELTQRFIEFLMMQAQQAAMFLGRIPNPATGQPEINLEVARLFIDQLEMLQQKTKGNLSKEEGDILTRILSDLQMTFVQVSGMPPTSPQATIAEEPEVLVPETAANPVSEVSPPAAAPAESENRKKFTKSYGA